MPIPFPNLAYGLFDIFVSIIQVLSHYSLYSFLTRIWLEIAQFLFLFGKLQAAAVEDQIWELIYINQIKNLKMLGFTWKEKAKLLRVASSLWSPCFCNRPFCGRRCYKTSVCITCWCRWLLVFIYRPSCHVCQIYKWFCLR